MKVLLFETNLLWSSKLKATLKGLGHDPLVLAKIPESKIEGDVAIVNLSQPEPSIPDLIRYLKSADIPVVAHAGHKEKELIALGREAGADILATNGELASKLDQILIKATAG